MRVGGASRQHRLSYPSNPGGAEVTANMTAKIADVLARRRMFRGVCELAIELQGTLVDGYGRTTRGLQNRPKGAVKASLVSSILIHPRQFWPE